jgi:hypothetical protein
MSAPALSDRLSRKSKLPSTGLRLHSTRKKSTPAPGRNNLIADFLAICELDPAVDMLRSAVRTTFLNAAQEIDHTADFEIVRDNEATLVDIVPEADLAHHPLRAALAGRKATSADGRLFIVETAASLRAEPRFTTVKLIMDCRRIPVSAGDRVRILHHLDECGTASLIECAGAVQNSRDGVAAVLALAVEGLISVDIDRPILPETRIRRRKLAFVG